MLELTVAFCKRFEGFRSKPYLCPANVPTIGYGTTYYLDGSKVTLSDPPITEQEAETLLVNILTKEYLPGVLRLCPGLSGNRLEAIVDFAYNLGLGNLKISTLRKRLNEGNYDAASTEILKWNKANGRILLGLSTRREAESRYL